MYLRGEYTYVFELKIDVPQDRVFTDNTKIPLLGEQEVYKVRMVTSGRGRIINSVKYSDMRANSDRIIKSEGVNLQYTDESLMCN